MSIITIQIVDNPAKFSCQENVAGMLLMLENTLSPDQFAEKLMQILRCFLHTTTLQVMDLPFDYAVNFIKVFASLKQIKSLVIHGDAKGIINAITCSAICVSLEKQITLVNPSEYMLREMDGLNCRKLNMSYCDKDNFRDETIYFLAKPSYHTWAHNRHAYRLRYGLFHSRKENNPVELIEYEGSNELSENPFLNGYGF